MRKRKRKGRGAGVTQPARGSKAGTILFVCCVLAFAAIPGLFESRPLLPQCFCGAVPGVVSNSQINGTLVKHGRDYLIDGADNQEHFLVRCHRSHCSGPADILSHQTPGNPAHVEFCGPYLTLISVADVLVYTAQPPMQDAMDRNFEVQRSFGLYALLFLECVGFGLAWFFVKKARTGLRPSESSSQQP